jgi:hypothetical protein
VRPVRSIAAMVFSNVGGAGSLAMRSISARFSAIAGFERGLEVLDRWRIRRRRPPAPARRRG